MQGNGMKLVYKLTFITSHSSSYLVLCKAVHRPGVYICHCPDTLTNVHVVDLKCLVGTAHQNYVFKTVRLVTWCSCCDADLALVDDTHHSPAKQY